MNEINGLRQEEEVKVIENQEKMQFFIGTITEGIQSKILATIAFFDKKNKQKKLLLEKKETEVEKLNLLELISIGGALEKNSESYLKINEYLKLGILSIDEIRESLIIYVKNQMLKLYNKIIENKENLLLEEFLSYSEKCLLVYCLRKSYIDENNLNEIKKIFLNTGINLDYYDKIFGRQHYVLILMMKLGLTHEQIKSNQYHIG